MIACVTVPMAVLESPGNAIAATPLEASPVIEQASSPVAMIAATTETVGRAVAARGGAFRENGVTVFGVPGGLDATRGTTRAVGTTERTVATLVVAYRRSLVVAARTEARERKLARARALVAARERAAEIARQKADPQGAICLVFGPHCREALRVAHCESRYDTGAQNGQYLGLFQMGSHERATYGHGSTPYDQAVAAYRYFVASGRTWGPWSCKPWS